jgi:hypothetical protein
MSTSVLRPGLMICTPTLHDPTPANAQTFLRWTKLHDRELLDLPAMKNGGKITRALRFVKQNCTGTDGEYVDSSLPPTSFNISYIGKEWLCLTR